MFQTTNQLEGLWWWNNYSQCGLKELSYGAPTGRASELLNMKVGCNPLELIRSNQFIKSLDHLGGMTVFSVGCKLVPYN